jgi:hypothetical protein
MTFDLYCRFVMSNGDYVDYDVGSMVNNYIEIMFEYSSSLQIIECKYLSRTYNFLELTNLIKSLIDNNEEDFCYLEFFIYLREFWNKKVDSKYETVCFLLK